MQLPDYLMVCNNKPLSQQATLRDELSSYGLAAVVDFESRLCQSANWAVSIVDYYDFYYNAIRKFILIRIIQ